MEINIARAFQKELQKKISELLKDYETKTELQVERIKLTRQPQYDSLGNETNFEYAVSVEVYL